MSEPTIITLGCRLNAFEAEIMRRHATDAGLRDAVIVNTCAVTGEAVRQASQAIRRLRRERPDASIIVTGCAAQIDAARFGAMPDVDHVIGNAEKIRPETFRALAARTSTRLVVDDIMSVRETAPHMIDGFGAIPRAWVQIQNGCDHRCTFCIIPFGRGPSRSVAPDHIVAQVRRLAANGIGEVVLTGVDITSYGADLSDGTTLGGIVQRVLHEVPEIARLRLSSIDQVETDPALLDAIANKPRLMPHLHLSMQSGSDLILKRMKRRHSRADAVAFCEQVRRLRPDMAFGADLIAGFPTETDAHFADTLSLVDDCGLSFLHVFPYSPRQGTPAARMPQTAGAVIAARARQLRAKGAAVLSGWLEQQTGAGVEAVLERPSGTQSPARTPQFAKVSVRGLQAGLPAGAIVQARVTGHDGAQLHAQASPAEAAS